MLYVPALQILQKLKFYNFSVSRFWLRATCFFFKSKYIILNIINVTYIIKLIKEQIHDVFR